MRRQRTAGWWVAALALLAWFALSLDASIGDLDDATLRSGAPVPALAAFFMALPEALILTLSAYTAVRLPRRTIGGDRPLAAVALYAGLALAFAIANLLLRMGARTLLAEPGPALSPARDVNEPFSVALVFLVFAGLAHAVEYARRYRKHEVAEARLEAELAGAELQRVSAELRMLKMQLNPDFLFNSLHAIGAMLAPQPQTAQRMVARLSDMLRRAMHGAAKQEVSLEEELEEMRPFIEMEQLRLGESFRVEFNVDDEALDALVPHMTLQPMLERAIAGGIAAAGGWVGGTVVVRAIRRDDWLELSVSGGTSDDGAGRIVERIPWHDVPVRSPVARAVPTGEHLLGGASAAAEPLLRFTRAEWWLAGAWFAITWMLGIELWYRNAQFYQRPAPFVIGALGAGLNALPWAVMLLFAMRLSRSHPVMRSGWRRGAAVHATSAFALGAAVIACKFVSQLVVGYPWNSAVKLDYAIGSLVAAVSLYLVFAGLAHAVQYTRRVREKQVAELRLQTTLAQAELQRTAAELRMLKTQLNPHFLFNSLNAVSALAPTEPDTARRVVAQLSDLLRHAMHSVATQEVPLEDELAGLRPFVEIEEILRGGALTVRWEIADEARRGLVPHMILQPLVENAVKHGIVPAGGRGVISIEAAQRDGWMELAVRDDGAGLAPAADAPRRDGGVGGVGGVGGMGGVGGVGAANVRARLEQLYGARQRFELRPAEGGGTLATIRLPWRVSSPTVAGASQPVAAL